ncbi:unnamed protein product [Effrenium voratum]|uniref:Uncharacterized protein n=1 Tax=Effrenium voratum TaxID=2562239 RepID=A0AA36MPP3_9DINO|nr:unnamed protein product [Effrenium voratum]
MGEDRADTEAEIELGNTEAETELGREGWQRPTTWPPRKPVPTRRDAPHVVLSTKFGKPWYTVSVGFKEILEEQGCTVYNPNTANAEIYKAEANDRWLRTFNENLEKVKESRGFVLQIQQGVVRHKSAMQVAEEKQSGWLNVPRIGVFAFPSTQHRGGGTLGEQHMAQAVEAARRQWAQTDVEMVSEVYEPLDGEAALPLKGNSIHGRARCIFPSGNVYEGEFQDDKRHGRGKETYADGRVYEGEYQVWFYHS